MRSFIYPYCCICGRFTKRGLLCLNCSPPKPKDPKNRCFYCFDDSKECIPCSGLKPRFEFFRFLYEFQDVKHIIRFLKFNPSRELAKFLADELKESAKDLQQDFDYIIPAPISNSSLYERGFNQSYILATKISKTLNVPLLNPLSKLSAPQSLLPPEKRVSPKIVSKKPLTEDKHVLLVDDVLTTGGTALASLEALGCKVSLLVLASASKNFPFLLRAV